MSTGILRLMDNYSYELMLFLCQRSNHDIISSARGLPGLNFLLGIVSLVQIYVVMAQVVIAP